MHQVVFLKRWLRTCFYLAYWSAAALVNLESRKKFVRLGNDLGIHDLRPQLPQKSLYEVVPASQTIEVLELEQQTYHGTLQELVAIVSIVKYVDPKKSFEIGTFDGRTTLNIASNVGANSKIYTLDLPPGTYPLPDDKTVGEKFAAHPMNTKIDQLFGDSKTIDLSSHFDRCQFVFVDAAHDYYSVKNDSTLAQQLLVKSGRRCILWHDYANIAGVTQALDELEIAGNASRFFRIQDTSLACLLFEN